MEIFQLNNQVFDEFVNRYIEENEWFSTPVRFQQGIGKGFISHNQLLDLFCISSIGI